jgi:transcriptional regulator with XRE-family HTH domain
MDHNSAFGKVLRQERLRKRHTQETLGFEAGLDRTYISLLELGRRSPTLDTIVALCTALDLALTDLVKMVEQLRTGDAAGDRSLAATHEETKAHAK